MDVNDLDTDTRAWGIELTKTIIVNYLLSLAPPEAESERQEFGRWSQRVWDEQIWKCSKKKGRDANKQGTIAATVTLFQGIGEYTFQVVPQGREAGLYPLNPSHLWIRAIPGAWFANSTAYSTPRQPSGRGSPQQTVPKVGTNFIRRLVCAEG